MCAAQPILARPLLQAGLPPRVQVHPRGAQSRPKGVRPKFGTDRPLEPGAGVTTQDLSKFRRDGDKTPAPTPSRERHEQGHE